MKTGTDLEQAADPAGDIRLPRSGRRDPGKNFKQGAFTGPVATDNTQGLAPGALNYKVPASVPGRLFRQGYRFG